MKMNMNFNIIKICIAILLLFLVFSDSAEVAQNVLLLRYESKDKKDPFIPVVTNDGQLLMKIQSEEKDIDLNLEGIIYESKGQSMAIINGEILKVDDSIGNVKIVEIRKDSIVYSKDGEIVTLFANGKE